MRPDLPSGTVTFLFTDVEGSTKLLHELGAEGYAEALAEHRRVIREACTAQRGVEVDTQGDAFFFAFPSAPGAVAAASAFIERLASGPIQVRVGLHTGTPLLTDEGYVGDDVHFAARVASSGHGGQVVVSSATAELVSDGLTDLGEHRLKDIEEAVPIFQLGEASFPPLKTISNTNLPRPASSFVGREQELAEVLACIEQGARLVTLAGPGGTGKTRLALEAASTLVPQYGAGVFWVGLASLRDPALVAETIAQTIGAKDGLAEHIGDREMLLLLDNLEQVIDAASELSALLTACPNLNLLVTSRELLRVQGEVEYPVPPLAEPEAVALFCERSRLEPSDEIAELCARLDSLPLAVELAAARTKALSPEQILERLSQRLDLLKGGRDADPRQQTLRATIEWSYDLLLDAEQQLFARLSVFAGGCTLEAAEEVCDANLDALQSLIEKSLVRFSAKRYWMLETIREHAEERLGSSGRMEDIRARHLHYILELASRLEATFASDAYRSAFSSELDNYRAALAWAELSGDLEAQSDLIGRSWPFWWYRGQPTEGLRWVESALARGRAEATLRTAKVLTAGAMFAYRAGDLGAATAYADESLAIANKLEVPEQAIWPHIFLGLCAGEADDLRSATEHQEEAIRLARGAGDRRMVGIATNNLGVIAEASGDIASAARLFRDALEISRELGALDEAPLELLNLARCLRSLEKPDEAVNAAKEGLALAHEAGNLPSQVDGFFILAALACEEDQPRLAAKLLAFAEVLRDRIGDTPERLEVEVRAEIVQQVVSAVGENEYLRALADERSMALDDAVEYALASID